MCTRSRSTCSLQQVATSQSVHGYWGWSQTEAPLLCKHTVLPLSQGDSLEPLSTNERATRGHSPTPARQTRRFCRRSQCLCDTAIHHTLGALGHQPVDYSGIANQCRDDGFGQRCCANSDDLSAGGCNPDPVGPELVYDRPHGCPADAWLDRRQAGQSPAVSWEFITLCHYFDALWPGLGPRKHDLFPSVTGYERGLPLSPRHDHPA
jgi:hypothetical protein